MQDRVTEVKDWLQKEYSGIRTGQAAPALLDSIKIESYGTLMQLQQVATVSVEDARTLRISPWDAGTIKAIEKSLSEADLGISVATDSSGLRAIFPELTGERRQQLIKLAKQKLEDARVSLRAARDEAVKAVEAAQKSGDISEDERFTQKEQIQKQVEAGNAALDLIFKQKEVEITK